ncbi:hypothetical protein [Rhodomicrobium vannielii]|uniref:hypothetical protein n=1 Tax=Rhodomicrobium vannielii TaxID=1069 RepID=UPI00145E689A|nr:hypothetical protein [Rhodomicrobium vannielii]
MSPNSQGKPTAPQPATKDTPTAGQEAKARVDQQPPGATQPPVRSGPVLVKSEASAAPVPTTRPELIQAIGKELARLGLYEGPVTKAWTKDIRSAAQRFSRAKKPQPTQALLASLRAAKRDEKSANAQPSLNMQTVTISLATVANTRPTESVNATTHAPTEGYLPPWASLGGQADQAPRTNAVAPRGRASKKAPRASAGKAKRLPASRGSKRPSKTKSMFANSGFAWPGQ